MSDATRNDLLQLEQTMATFSPEQQAEIERLRVQIRALAKLHGDQGSYAICLLAAEIIDFVDGATT